VSVVDRGDPQASRSEWHGDGTAGEHDAARSLPAMATSSGGGWGSSSVTTCVVATAKRRGGSSCAPTAG